MRRLAIRGVLSGKLADGELVIIDSFEALEPRTKSMVTALKSLNIGDKKTLIFTTGEETTLRLAAGNLPHVRMLSAHLLSVVDMLKHDVVVMPRAALDIVTGILGNGGGRRKLVLRGRASSDGTTATPTAMPTANVALEPTATVAATAAATIATPTAEVEAEPEVAPKAEAKPARKSTPKAEKAEAAAPIAAGAVKIGKVHYEGDESIELHNTGDAATNLAGYTLRDKNDNDQSFTFPEGAEINPGGKLTVFTAPGHKYTFDSKGPIWNDKGDQVELLDASGKVLDTFSYGSYATDSAAKTESEG